MTIDLRTCVPGQLVELRNGNIVRYADGIHDSNKYPHMVGDKFYTDDGHYFACRKEDDDDVVRILQLDKPEAPKSDKHPSIAWWESCPWITNRKPTEEDSDASGWVIIKAIDDFRSCTAHWANVQTDQYWVHRLHWKPPTLTDKEQALQLINNHEDGWRPTPEQWNVIRAGLKAS